MRQVRRPDHGRLKHCHLNIVLYYLILILADQQPADQIQALTICRASPTTSFSIQRRRFKPKPPILLNIWIPNLSLLTSELSPPNSPQNSLPTNPQHASRTHQHASHLPRPQHSLEGGCSNTEHSSDHCGIGIKGACSSVSNFESEVEHGLLKMRGMRWYERQRKGRKKGRASCD